MKKILPSLLIAFFCLGFAHSQNTWINVGNGVSGFVKTMAVDSGDNTLVVGGKFIAANGSTVNRIGKWDGASWINLGGGMNGDVEALLVFNGQLYAGGSFTTAGITPCKSVGRWNGSSWLLMNGINPGNTVHSLIEYNNYIYAGTDSGLKKWNGTVWVNVGGGPGEKLSGRINVLKKFGTFLIIGGKFNKASGDDFDYIARYNGTSITSIGTGANAEVTDMVAFNSKFYVGGKFSTINGVTVNGVGEFNGVSWNPAGSDNAPGDFRFQVFSSELYAYGAFSTFSSNTFRKLNAGSWQVLDADLNGPIRAFAVYNNQIHAGGEFTNIQNSIVPISYFGKYGPLPFTIYKDVVNVSCNGYNNASINTTGYGGAYPYTYLWGGSETTASLTGLAPGTYTLTVTDNASQTASVSVTITEPAPIVPNVSTTVLNCNGSACASPTGGNGGYSFVWAPAPTYGQNTSCITGDAGNYNITVTDNKGCTGTSTLTLSSIGTIPSSAVTASGPTLICLGDTVTLTASSASSYQWSNSATTQSIKVFSGGNYTVTVTNAGSCSTVSSPVTVTIKFKPSGTSFNAGGPTTICSGDSVGLNAVVTAGYSYQWLLNGTAIPGATLTTYQAKTPGLYKLSASNSCGADTSVGKNIYVNSTPMPTVTSPVDYCKGATSSCLPASGTGLKWYTVPVGGIASSVCPVPSTAVGSTTTYYVTQTQLGCESQRANIVVNVYATPAPGVTSPVSLCINVPASPLTATGSSLLWYNAATGGTGSSSAPTPVTNTAGTTNFWVSQTANSCEGPRAQIVVNVYSTPKPLGTDAGFCFNGTAIPLTASGSNLLWYPTLSGGTGTAIAPTPSTTATGTFYFYVSQTLNGCEGPRDSVKVTVTDVLAPVTATASYCQNSSPGCLSATGTALKWYYSDTSVTSYACMNPATAVTGTTSYYVSQTIAGCEGPRASMAVTIKPTPTAPSATSPLTYCKKANTNPLTATGSNLLWYTVPTGGTGTSTAIKPQSAIAGTNSYYVTQSLNGCESPRQTIVVKINDVTKPGVNPGGPLAFCQGGSVSLNAYGAVTGETYKWSTGSTAKTITVSTSGNYFVILTNAIGCKDTSNVLNITVNPIPSPVITALSSTSFCYGKYVVLKTSQSYSGYSWSNGVSSANDTVYATGNYSVVVNDNIGCSNSSNVIPVTVGNPATINLTVNGKNAFCKGDSTTLSAPSGYLTYQWNNGAMTKDLVVKTPGDYWASATNANGCVDLTSTQHITVNALPQPIITKAGGALSASSGNAYQWYLNDTLIAGATNQLYVPKTGGVYTVMVTNASGCSAMSPGFTLGPLAIMENDISSLAEIFPNPSIGDVRVSLDLPHSSHVLLEIYTLDGRKLLELANGAKVLKGKQEFLIPATVFNYGGGVYLLSIRLDQGTILKKITRLK